MTHTPRINGVLRLVLLVGLIFILQQDSSVKASHIVFLHTVSSYSHRAPQWPLILALMEQGHNVTFISGYAGGSEMSHPNVSDLVIPELREVMDFMLSKFDINFRIYGVQPPALLVLEPISYFGCSAIHSSPVFQSWLQAAPSIDLIISDTNPECGYGLVAKFGAKHAVFQTTPLLTKYYEAFGLSKESGSVPSWEVMTGKPPIPFLTRVVAAVLPVVWRLQQIMFYNFLYLSLFTKNLDLGEVPAPALYDLEASTSLVFVNGNYLEDYPRPYPPFVVTLPGIHIRDTGSEKIEPTLENFISSNESDGFILISFGTVANAPSLPAFFRNIFFQSMEAFPNLKFIWRWKGPKPAAEDYPKNLILVPWVNQQKLMSHPKIKGFITQAGRPSMQEAFYHGVPTIAFPILGDQDYNAYKYEHLGTTVYMDIASVTQPQLMDVINRTLTDEAWRKRVKSMAALGRDVPLPSVKVALWWTEFILRHTPEELNLLKPLAQKLYWFQRRELDVWAFLLCFSLGISFAFFRFGSFLLRKLSQKFIKSKTE